MTMREMRGRVVVVASDPTVRGMITTELAGHGLDVLEAADGAAGLDRIARGEPVDVVVLDLEMPESDGLGLVRTLAGDERTTAVPVIVLVNREQADQAARAVESGALDFLHKPVQVSELLARLGAGLRISRLQHDLRACRLDLQEIARTDHLTGLANRGHVDEHLSMAASAARRHNLPLALCLVDVDHFRRINEAEGHLAGDDVLREVARRTARVLRGEDMAGRWGGEELLVVAPNTDLDGAWRLGERVREAVSAAPIPVSTGRDVLVTVSVGCATGDGDDIDAQLRRVELALERAKSGGRNRVITDAGTGIV